MWQNGFIPLPRLLISQGMKKILIIVSFLLICSSGFAQSLYPKDSLRTDNWSQKDSLQMHLMVRMNQKAAPNFKLYKTDNIWTFLRLETATGRIWQVHFSVDSPTKRGVLPLNTINLGLIYGSGDQYAGRFELYKTENMYNFILLDTESGAVWQAQWSYDEDKRGILRIYE